jgi:hypothetical protein
MNAPSKRIRILMASSILTVSVIISLSLVLKTNAERSIALEAVTDVSGDIRRETIANDRDEDGDGLVLWEESLWGTSDEDMDSDNDGVSDGQAVADGKDPSGRSSFSTGASSSGSAAAEYEPGETDPTSLTSRLSQALFSNYAEISAEGTLTADTMSQLTQQLANEANTEASYKAVYSLNDVTLAKGESAQIAREYANALISNLHGGLLGALNNPNANEDLGVIGRSYRDIAQAYIKIPVPPELAGNHVSLANNFYNTYISLQDVYNYKIDPVKALLSLKTYSLIAEQQPAHFAVVQEHLKKNGILFTLNEPAAAGFPELIQPE